MITALAAAQLAAATLSTGCEDLTALQIPRATVTSATAVAEGIFQPPAGSGFGGPAARQPAEPIPAHCRVTMLLAPTPSSNINVELWLPLEHWNGKYLAVGNGGWAGSIQGYGDMQEALRRGYATSATDTGHSAADGPSGMFALGEPEKVVDFAFRAVHEMADKSKRVMSAFYADPLRYSYFKGCSTGGRQAVMAAQRYPNDFDGIIAGALANRHVRMHTASVALTIHLSRHPEEAIPEHTARMVNEAVMQQCDTLGEGFLNNPRQCGFDFSTLLCAGTAANDCLTEAQLRTVQTFYGGVRNSAGELIFSGQALGNPLPAMPSTNAAPNPFVFDTVRILGFQNPDYDWRGFDLDRDMPLIDEAAEFIDADDPDLRFFKSRGGKLLLYHGWGDTGITAENTIRYYERVLEEMGPDQDDWLRLFLVPGMGHCRGGPGPNTFDSISALEQWREEGVAPDELMGSNPQTGLARPICPYPKYAHYDGRGDLAEAASWTCSAD